MIDSKLIITSWDGNSYGDIRPQWILLQQNPTKRPWISYDSQSQSDWHLRESNPHSHRLWERLRGSSLCLMQVKVFCIHWRKSKKESTSIPTHDFFSIESEALILGQPFSSKKLADLRQHSNQQNKSSKIHLSQLSGTKGSTNPFHHQIKDTKGKGKTRTKNQKNKKERKKL